MREGYIRVKKKQPENGFSGCYDYRDIIHAVCLRNSSRNTG
ncbi:hypothetical protein SME22J_21390 [Serratia marcescens]|jgi:hypothetical protein|nr:hypothetical protein SME22J_21390 [Serratia marcescens]BEO42708.1 hypothetical protein SMQE13_20590 [Serratia marcescens]